ncbi:MAG: flippase [Lachnospiraceae bacterium]|nr:flippase [Lachnospiraceae bacterium]
MNQPSVKKNYFFRLFYDVLTLITPFITTPYISRVLGADGVGIHSYTSSVIMYFSLFAALGTVSYGAREIARHRDDRAEASKLFWEIELLTVLTSAVCLVLWIGFIAFSTEYRYYYLALTPMLLATTADISWFFMGHEQIKHTVTGNSICKLLGIAVLFLLVREKDDLLMYCVISSCVQFAGNLTMWIHLPKMLDHVDFGTLSVRRHLKETLIYFIPTVATSVYTVLDKTLIGLITKNTYENGYYEQATRVINIVKSLVFTAVNMVMEARISYLFVEKKYEEIKQRITDSMDFILLAGFGCAFGISGIASVFVPLFFGAGYEPVVTLLYMMAPLIVIIGVSNCLGSQYYTPSGKRKQSAGYIVAGSVVNICLNLVLIPGFGAGGATIASIIAELTIAVLYLRSCDGYMTAGVLWSRSWKRLIAGSVMLVAVIATGRYLKMAAVTVVVAQIAVGVGIYGIILLLLKDSMLKNILDMGIGLIRKGDRKDAAD